MDLFYLNGKNKGEKFELTPPGVSIGREVDNDLQLLINGVSRYHAMVSFDGSDWFIEDLGSTNGTRIGGKNISEKVKLTAGMEFYIGDQGFRFGDAPAEPASEKAKTAAAKTSKVAVKEIPEEKPDLASQIRRSRTSIFGGTPGKNTESGKNGKKGRLGNLIFTLVVILIPLVCIFGYMVMLERDNIRKNVPPPAPRKQPFLLYYEKTVVSPDNVFRFEAKIENDTAVFTVDDLKYGRHNVVRESNLKPESLDSLKDSIRNTGFMKLADEQTNTPAGPKDELRTIMISLDSHFNKVSVHNTYAKTSFENVETAIADFAENFDIRVDSLTEEEMRKEAENSFRRAEELLANYQASPENIRNSILRYRNAMKYYEQFEPKPKEWDICRKQLLKAENIYKQQYQGLVFNIQKYNKLRQFDKASEECRKMLELVEPDSQEYKKYKKYKVSFDKQLRRKK